MCRRSLANSASSGVRTELSSSLALLQGCGTFGQRLPRFERQSPMWQPRRQPKGDLAWDSGPLRRGQGYGDTQWSVTRSSNTLISTTPTPPQKGACKCERSVPECRARQLAYVRWLRSTCGLRTGSKKMSSQWFGAPVEGPSSPNEKCRRIVLLGPTCRRVLTGERLYDQVNLPLNKHWHDDVGRTIFT